MKVLIGVEVLAHRTPMPANPARASAHIHNSLAEASTSSRSANVAELFRPHRLTEERIRRLREYRSVAA